MVKSYMVIMTEKLLVLTPKSANRKLHLFVPFNFGVYSFLSVLQILIKFTNTCFMNSFWRWDNFGIFISSAGCSPAGPQLPSRRAPVAAPLGSICHPAGLHVHPVGMLAGDRHPELYEVEITLWIEFWFIRHFEWYGNHEGRKVLAWNTVHLEIHRHFVSWPWSCY